MGLAPYGEPKYADAIRRELVDLKPDGSFRLNPGLLQFSARHHHDQRAVSPTCSAGRRAGRREKLERRHMDVARSIQLVTEEIMLRLARHAREVTGLKKSLPGRRRGARTAWPTD